jgi:fatty acid desaturase
VGLRQGGEVTSAQLRRTRRGLEPLTLLLAASIYGGWLLLTWWWHAVPLVLGLPLAAWLLAWHGSLQHEAVHGHPTGRRWLDTLIAGPPLALWLPFPVYRSSHLAHHRTPSLTDPLDDPESYYVTPETWAGLGPVRRAALLAMQTVAGRLLLGPPVVVGRLLVAEARGLLSGDVSRVRVWAVHLAAAAAVLGWVVGVCGIAPGTYLLCFVYPGLSLTLVRSFTEHRPAADQASRSAIVEAGPVFSLLFLNNNLHALHHAEPGLPWYRLPAVYRQRRAALLAGNGGFRFGGYGEILRRHALVPKDAPVLPPVAAGRARDAADGGGTPGRCRPMEVSG